MRTVRAAFLVVVLVSLLGGCSSQRVIAEFDIAKNGRLITLPVKVGGKEYQFLLDTGSNCCGFDATFRPSLGTRIRAREVITAAGPRTLDFYNAPEAFLGNIRLEQRYPVACFDIEMLRCVSDLEIRGIIGMSVLGNYVVQVDFDRGKLRLLEPEGVGHPEWGEHVPIVRNRLSLPSVRGELSGGIEDTFILDTGVSGAGDLREDLFEQIVRQDNLKTSETLVETMGGTLRRSEARVPGVSIGGVACKDLIFHKSDASKLGLGWFSRFRVTFDFPCRRLYLKTSAGFRRPSEANMSGLYLFRVNGQVKVHSTARNSPAASAGVRAKDVIHAVDGIPSADLDLRGIRLLLNAGDKKKITLSIQRGDEEKTIALKLRKQI
jgi:hypothetical protein